MEIANCTEYTNENPLKLVKIFFLKKVASFVLNIAKNSVSEVKGRLFPELNLTEPELVQFMVYLTAQYHLHWMRCL